MRRRIARFRRALSPSTHRRASARVPLLQMPRSFIAKISRIIGPRRRGAGFRHDELAVAASYDATTRAPRRAAGTQPTRRRAF